MRVPREWYCCKILPSGTVMAIVEGLSPASGPEGAGGSECLNVVCGHRNGKYMIAKTIPMRLFSIAPMMEWTDRHCGFFHRLLTRRALIYTEMLTTGAVLRGARRRLLDFDAGEHHIALQLGGCDPKQSSHAASIGEAF